MRRWSIVPTLQLRWGSLLGSVLQEPMPLIKRGKHQAWVWVWCKCTIRLTLTSAWRMPEDANCPTYNPWVSLNKTSYKKMDARYWPGHFEDTYPFLFQVSILFLHFCHWSIFSNHRSICAYNSIFLITKMNKFSSSLTKLCTLICACRHFFSN